MRNAGLPPRSRPRSKMRRSFTKAVSVKFERSGSRMDRISSSTQTVSYPPTSPAPQDFLRLERGKARFEVAREKRPFIVSVGDAQVTAHGTIFDVGFRSDRTYFVRLLRGSVDVAQKLRGPTNRPSRTPRLLTPGQVVEAGLFGVRDLPPSFAPASGESWTSKMRQFDNVRVADLIDEANRYSRVQIRQPIAEVANLRASGTFAIDDPRRLATNLSLLFGLKVTEMPGEAIALSPSEIKISHSEEQTP